MDLQEIKLNDLKPSNLDDLETTAKDKAITLGSVKKVTSVDYPDEDRLTGRSARKQDGKPMVGRYW